MLGISQGKQSESSSTSHDFNFQSLKGILKLINGGETKPRFCKIICQPSPWSHTNMQARKNHFCLDSCLLHSHKTTIHHKTSKRVLLHLYYDVICIEVWINPYMFCENAMRFLSLRSQLNVIQFLYHSSRSFFPVFWRHGKESKKA